MEYKIIADGACDLYGENADKSEFRLYRFMLRLRKMYIKKRVRKLKSATSIKKW